MLKSDNKFIYNWFSKPPFALGVSAQALCEKWESVEQHKISQFLFENSAFKLFKATISVGQTKVKSKG